MEYVDVIFTSGKKGTILKKEYEAGGSHIKCLASEFKEEKMVKTDYENKALKPKSKKGEK
jgi:hypothetical protein